MNNAEEKLLREAAEKLMALASVMRTYGLKPEPEELEDALKQRLHLKSAAEEAVRAFGRAGVTQ